MYVEFSTLLAILLNVTPVCLDGRACGKALTTLAQANSTAAETIPMLPSVSIAEAVERFELRKRMERFRKGNVSGKNVRVHTGDLRISGDLVLDFDDQMRQGEINYDPIWQNHQGLIITGDLCVEGNVINANSDYGAFLFVGGNLKSKNLIGGGSDIVVMGNADIQELVLGHYNDGALHINGRTSAQLVISDDHDTVIKTAAPYWDSHADVIAMPLSEYLHRDIKVKRVAESGPAVEVLFVEEFDVEQIISHLTAGMSVLREPDDRRPRTSRDQWLRIVRVHGVALRHVPNALIDSQMCLLAMANDGRALQHVPANLKTTEICFAAVAQNGYALRFVERNLQTPELQLVAVRNEGNALEYVPLEERTKAICLAAVSTDSRAIAYVPESLRDWVKRELP